jgi:hypothetical protein
MEIERTPGGGWRLSDDDGQVVGEYGNWRDAEEERIWGGHKSDDGSARVGPCDDRP